MAIKVRRFRPIALARALRDRLLLEMDQAIWWFQTAKIRRRYDFSLPDKYVLICNLMTMIAGVKAEALFASALRSKGYKLIVLLPGPYSIIERYYRAVGPVEFVYLDSLIDVELRRKCLEAAENVVNKDPDFSSLFNFSPGGYRIGRNVLSKVVRQLRVGRIDPANPVHRNAIRNILAESMAVMEACERLLDKKTPDVALFNERGYTPAGEIFDGCLLRGVDCIQWFGAPQSDCMAYKRYRLETRDNHPLSLADDTWRALQKLPWGEANDTLVMNFLRKNYETGQWFNRQRLQEGKKLLSADSVKSRLGLNPNKKIAVIFAHILYDATFFYGDSLFPDYETWLIETVRCAVNNPNLNWIIKVHPVNVWRSRMDGVLMEQLECLAIEREIGTLPGHVKILPADTDINTYALFSITDYGLTVRGTVGLELPCYGVPVVTAGSGRYSGRGFTIDPKTFEEFRDTLACLHEKPPLDSDVVKLARIYAYGTFFLRAQQMDGFVLDYNANTFGSAALKYNTRPTPNRIRRLEEANDLGLFCSWVSDNTSHDMIDWGKPSW